MGIETYILVFIGVFALLLLGILIAICCELRKRKSQAAVSPVDKALADQSYFMYCQDTSRSEDVLESHRSSKYGGKTRNDDRMTEGEDEEKYDFDDQVEEQNMAQDSLPMFE